MSTKQLREEQCRNQSLKIYIKHLVNFKPKFRRKEQKHKDRMKEEACIEESNWLFAPHEVFKQYHPQIIQRKIDIGE